MFYVVASDADVLKLKLIYVVNLARWEKLCESWVHTIIIARSTAETEETIENFRNFEHAMGDLNIRSHALQKVNPALSLK